MDTKKKNKPETATPDTCGIIIPISQIDGCSEEHWADVLEIHTDAIESAGLEPNVVSSADDVGVIQKRIIQNLYSNPIVVCDVSGKNPNVMLELGIRLAFDRAVVIVKDDKTPYSFDTSSIEHLTYPRDLRFSRIVDFKKELKDKITKTLEASKSDPNFSPFLKHFGQFTVAKIDTREVSSDQYIIEQIKMLRREIQGMHIKHRLPAPVGPVGPEFNYNIRITTKETVNTEDLANSLLSIKDVNNVEVETGKAKDTITVSVLSSNNIRLEEISDVIKNMISSADFTTNLTLK